MSLRPFGVICALLVVPASARAALPDPMHWYPLDGSLADVATGDPANALSARAPDGTEIAPHFVADRFGGQASSSSNAGYTLWSDIRFADLPGSTCCGTADGDVYQAWDVDFTVSLWIRPDLWEVDGWVSYIGRGMPLKWADIGIDSSYVGEPGLYPYLNLKTMDGGYFAPGPWTAVPYVAGQWMHVVLLRDAFNDTIQLWVDGSLVYEVAGVAPRGLDLPAHSLALPTFYGAVDDLRIYDVALDSEAIEDLYFAVPVDTDGNGLCDLTDDLDTDGDSTADDCDACPDDLYNDGDGDGSCDSDDPCPLDPQDDADADGVCADLDVCPLDADDDLDGDRICGDFDLCPEDAANDVDGDGICGEQDACPGGDDGQDSDGDGTADACDPCPLDAFNDADGDGFCADADLCPLDPVDDLDGDGSCADVDPCPADADDDLDGDAMCADVDPCPVDPENDADGDGICEVDDTCPSVADSAQVDSDGDGTGDACEPDADGDGVADDLDNCPLLPNADQADRDGDGAGDPCDLDSDDDGLPDDLDACPGTAEGEPVDDDGCSVDQQCPCDGAWKNKGAYQSCVARAAGELVGLGVLSSSEKDALVAAAAARSCGRR